LFYFRLFLVYFSFNSIAGALQAICENSSLLKQNEISQIKSNQIKLTIL